MSIFTVYRVTNLLNNKIYVGVHKTDDPDDDYLGSGKLVTAAVQKYGPDQFRKEILFTAEDMETAYRREAEIVTAEFIAREDTYNLVRGGAIPGWYFQQGDKNSQWGTVWVSRDGEKPRKVKQSELQAWLDQGWDEGRGGQFREKMKAVPLSDGFRHGKPSTGRVVVHKDGREKMAKPEDLDQLLSLGWQRGTCYRRQSSRRLTKLLPGQVAEIRSLYKAGGVSQSQLGRRFGVSQMTVSEIVRDPHYGSGL